MPRHEPQNSICHVILKFKTRTRSSGSGPDPALHAEHRQPGKPRTLGSLFSRKRGAVGQISEFTHRSQNQPSLPRNSCADSVAQRQPISIQDGGLPSARSTGDRGLVGGDYRARRPSKTMAAGRRMIVDLVSTLQHDLRQFVITHDRGRAEAVSDFRTCRELAKAGARFLPDSRDFEPRFAWPAVPPLARRDASGHIGACRRERESIWKASTAGSRRFLSKHTCAQVSTTCRDATPSFTPSRRRSRFSTRRR